MKGRNGGFEMNDDKDNKKSKKDSKDEHPGKLAVNRSYMWEPLDLMRSLDAEFDEFRRAIERNLWWPTVWRRPTMESWGEPGWLGTRLPILDIRDTGKELVIEAEMPGIPKENIDIQVTEKAIEICGEMRSEEKDGREGYVRQERSYSTCYRQVPLPAEVEPNQVNAELKDGILTITMPKRKPKEEIKKHKVNVK